MGWLGIDVGGANLKASDNCDFARTVAFPLWQRPKELARALRDLVGSAPEAKRLAVTMTGELADCFVTKAEGVAAILDAVEQAAESRPVRVYLVDGSLVEPSVARTRPMLAAASNWHALARYASRHVPEGNGLLVDIGSTTCDLIPLSDGMPAARGSNDPERLVQGELVYTGVVRSPICALVQALPWRGRLCPTADEVFATTRDVYLTLGDLAEDADDCLTADHRPATKEAARDRLARSICADREMFDTADAMAAATTVAKAQLARLGIGLQQVLRSMPSPPQVAVLAGQGEFLARRLLERMRLPARIVSLERELGAQRSRVATAYALAVLATEAEPA